MVRSIVRDEPKLLDRARTNAGTLAGAVGVFWLVHLVNVLTGYGLVGLGIVPRAVDGLVGIAFAPFLHASLAHLLLNSVSFLLLGAITMVRRRMDFWVVSAVGALGSGLGVWLFAGASTVTVGASGVIFAYLGFLMARGLFERSVQAVVLSVVVTWLFGSMLWGVLPAAVGISWQAHLFGWLSGVGAAATLGNAMRAKKRG